MTNRLTLRIDDLCDPVPRGQVSALLRDIFDIDLQAFNDLGFWPADYRAYSYMDGDLVASNVSCFPLPLTLGCETVMAGGIQSVASRPPYRQMGLFRDLMQRVIAYAEDHYACLLLYTDTPALYRPFGFRLLEEQSFPGRLAMSSVARTAPDMRRLSLDAREDIALIRGLFSRREPVSHHLGLRHEEAAFFLNALWYRDWQLTFLPDDDALVISDRQDGRTRLLDIVASRIPPAERLAAVLDLAEREIEVCFPPDRLSGEFAAIPHFDPDAGHLMARGPFAIEGTAFRLPPTAAF